MYQRTCPRAPTQASDDIEHLPKSVRPAVHSPKVTPKEAERVFRAAGALTVRDGRGGSDRGGRGPRGEDYDETDARSKGGSRRRDGGSTDEGERENGDARRAPRGGRETAGGNRRSERDVGAGGSAGGRGERRRERPDGEAGTRAAEGSRKSRNGFAWDETDKTNETDETTTGGGGGGGGGRRGGSQGGGDGGLVGDLMKGHSRGGGGGGPEDGLSAIMVTNKHRNDEMAARQELRSLTCQQGGFD